MNDDELQAVFDAIHQVQDVILAAIDKQTESSIMAGKLLANALRAELADIQLTIDTKMKDAGTDK